MQIFYNTDTRQLIVVETDKAMTAYLQADETPTQKAKDMISAYHRNPANVTTCEKIIQKVDDDPLPIEDGPKPEIHHGENPTIVEDAQA